MFGLILLAFLAYRNGARAKRKGLNQFVWGALTVVSFLFFFIIGGMVVIFNFLGNSINYDLFSSTDPNVRKAVTSQLQQALESNPLHMATILIIGLGGYLLIRFLIDSKPDKQEPNIHWMDKMGQGQEQE